MMEEKKPAPQDLAGDGLGDAPGQASGAGSASGEAAAGAEMIDEARPEGLARELEQARELVADMTARLARTQADFDNYRKRAQKDREDLMAYANQKLLVSLLPVLDNLDRALATATAPGDEKLRQGVELTARSFREILTREGVTPIEAVGQPFDPNFHEAVMTVSSDEHYDDVVVAEFQRGYKLGDRVVRPSMVQVNKKG